MLRANDVKRIPLPCEAEVVYEWRSSPQVISYLSSLGLSQLLPSQAQVEEQEMRRQACDTTEDEPTEQRGGC
jgi:hypothetical protein